jgi:hypothetical protein
VEGDGFESSVPQQIRSRFRESSPASDDRFDGFATRNRKFESISRGESLQPDALDRLSQGLQGKHAHIGVVEPVEGVPFCKDAPSKRAISRRGVLLYLLKSPEM